MIFISIPIFTCPDTVSKTYFINATLCSFASYKKSPYVAFLKIKDILHNFSTKKIRFVSTAPASKFVSSSCCCYLLWEICMYENMMASDGVTCISYFVKTAQLFQKLKGNTYTLHVDLILFN